MPFDARLNCPEIACTCIHSWFSIITRGACNSQAQCTVCCTSWSSMSFAGVNLSVCNEWVTNRPFRSAIPSVSVSIIICVYANVPVLPRPCYVQRLHNLTRLLPNWCVPLSSLHWYSKTTWMKCFFLGSKSIATRSEGTCEFLRALPLSTRHWLHFPLAPSCGTISTQNMKLEVPHFMHAYYFLLSFRTSETWQSFYQQQACMHSTLLMPTFSGFIQCPFLLQSLLASCTCLAEIITLRIEWEYLHFGVMQWYEISAPRFFFSDREPPFRQTTAFLWTSLLYRSTWYFALCLARELGSFARSTKGYSSWIRRCSCDSVSSQVTPRLFRNIFKGILSFVQMLFERCSSRSDWQNALLLG